MTVFSPPDTGCAFHEAILSVYLTGLENGMCAARENFGKEERKS